MSRRAGLLAVALLVGAAALGVVLWVAARDDSDEDGLAETIGFEELRRYPPIAFAWAPERWATSTATGDLYVVRADGSALRRLASWPRRFTDSPFGVNDVHWSPDGREIAALLWAYSCEDPCARLAVVSPDGRRLRSRSPAKAGGLAWSPDGRELLYSLAGELRTVASDSGKAVRIWRAPSGVGEHLEWMPDGRSVLFASRGIVKLTLRSRKAVTLTRFAGDEEPVSSPDGRLVAFIRQRACWGLEGCRDPANVYVIGVDGTALRRLTRNTDARSLHWSPDGRSILFGDRAGGVKLLDVDQEGVRSLTSDAASWPIDWSPDGRKILFWRPGTLWVMDADGGRPTRLPFHRPGWSVMTPDWRG